MVRFEEKQMTLVAIMTVRREALHEFRAFEAAALRILREHGGCLERNIVVAGDSSGAPREVHVVTFPDEAAFEAYRTDARLRELQPLRDQAVLATEILIGEDGPISVQEHRRVL